MIDKLSDRDFLGRQLFFMQTDYNKGMECYEQEPILS